MSGPNFRFSSNIPQAPQRIPATQAPILSNFQSVNEYIDVNHVGFTNAVDYGKHNFTTLVQVPSNTDPSTSATEMKIYCKSVANDTNGFEIFARYPSNGNVEQLTGVVGPTLPGANGYSYINSSLLVKWGTLTMSGATGTFSFPTGGSIPAFATAVYMVQLVPNAAPGFSYATSANTITTTSFKYTSVNDASGNTASWWAIGI